MSSSGSQPGRPRVEVRPGRRRGDGQLPPARRRRRSTTRSSAWRSRSRCATRSSTGRATSGTSTATPPPRMRYTECRLARMASELLRDIDADTVDFGPELRRVAQASRRCCRRASRTCSSTARPGSRSAWRRTSRRTTSARSIDALVALIDEPGRRRREAVQARQGPRLPDRRDHRRPRRDQGGVPLRPRPRRHARARARRGAARRPHARS